MSEFMKDCWTLIGTCEKNAAQTLTKAAATGFKHYLSSLTAVVSTDAIAAGGAIININTASATETYRFTVPASTAVGATVHYELPTPIPTKSGQALNIVQAAGGGSAQITLSACGFTVAG